jgi:hypothetical protein
LGIGPNSGGPGPSVPVKALPGDLGQGVLINEPAHLLTFGPNPGTALASVTGAPIGNLLVLVNNGATTTPVNATIDSGGVYGTIPANVGYQTGDTITVYNSSGTTLYSYTPTGASAPTTIATGTTMNTGHQPFSQQPIYIDYTVPGGETVFDA